MARTDANPRVNGTWSRENRRRRAVTPTVMMMMLSSDCWRVELRCGAKTALYF